MERIIYLKYKALQSNINIKYQTLTPSLVLLLLALSWICSTLSEFRFRHFVPVNSICSLSGFTSFHPYANPLSWICSTLPEFRFRHFVPVNSICSLSGFTSFHPYANPQNGHATLPPSARKAFSLEEGVIIPSFWDTSSNRQNEVCRVRLHALWLKVIRSTG